MSCLQETRKPAVAIASEGGHGECVRLLAEYKADLNALYSENGLCAVHRLLDEFIMINIASVHIVSFY